MSLTKSGLYVQTFKDIMIQTAYTPANINLTLATYKISLWDSAMVDGSGLMNFSSATPAWANTNEVSGTGWATGGVLLSAAATGGTSATPTFAEGTTGSLRYDHTNDLSVASTTLTTGGGPFGCFIYADPVSSPVAKPLIVAVNFLAAFPTNNGTFGITWSGTGIFEIDVTP